MKFSSCKILIIILFSSINTVCQDQNDILITGGSTIGSRFKTPPGYERIYSAEGGFSEWLRNLPLKEGRPPVRLYDGSLKYPRFVHAAVVDMDVGKKDLQQCADCIIRLRAEYLWQKKDYDALCFKFTSGDLSRWDRWRDGWRPIVNGSRVKWIKSMPHDGTYENFRRWLENVFYYAGTISLSRDLHIVNNINDIQIGDVFVEAGSPGHAVMIVDMAENKETGDRIMLLLQSYMPAQEMHILINPNRKDISPWYRIDFGYMLRTPEWDFKKEHLRRFIDD